MASFIPHNSCIAGDDWLDVEHDSNNTSSTTDLSRSSTADDQGFGFIDEEPTSWASTLTRTVILFTLPIMLPAYGLWLVWAVMMLVNDTEIGGGDTEMEVQLTSVKEKGQEGGAHEGGEGGVGRMDGKDGKDGYDKVDGEEAWEIV